MDSHKNKTKASDNSDPEKLTLRKRLYLALMDALSALSFESKVIDDFYLYVSATHSKKHFRLALNFIIFNCLYLMLIVPFSGANDEFSMKYFGLVVMVVAIVLYISTIGFISPAHYQPISLIIITLYLSLHIFSHKAVASVEEYTYVLPVEMFLIIFAWLPFNIDVAISLSLMYSIVYMSFVEFRIADFGEVSKELKNKGEGFIIGITPNETKFFVTILNLDYYPEGILIQCLYLHVLGVYIHYSNRLRRRASFLRLGESVKLQMKSQITFDAIMKYIESTMPVSVKDMYWKERKNMNDDDLWVFSNNYDNVTILFTDMVGFTEMNVNKRANEVINLLSDLFNRFDQGCEMTNCEKIGTIGDCYYCVSGCPSPRSDHAACCIEVSFKMFSELKAFNQENEESLDMRIGIHTGRINGAIIGKLRFKFDVYSNDVLITKKIASSGKAGLVRISEATYNLVNCIYTVENGPPIEILKEVPEGLQGMRLNKQKLLTFFILKREIIASSRNHRWQTDIQNSLLRQNRTLSSESLEEDSRGELNDKGNLTDPYHLFVHHFANDPDQIMKLFSFLPVHNALLNFIDDDLEQMYQSHFHDFISEMTLDSTKLAPLTDTLASLVCSLIIFFSAWTMADELVNKWWYIILSLFILAVIFTIIIATITTYNPIIKTGKTMILFRAASNKIFRGILLSYMASLPCLITFTLYRHDLFYQDYHYTTFIISLFIVSLLNFVLCSPILFVLKMVVLGSVVFVAILRLSFTKVDNLSPTSSFCSNNFWKEIAVRSCLQIILNFVMIIFLNRENQKNLRLCFYITRIVQKRQVERKKRIDDAEAMLFSILPRYVLGKFCIKKGDMNVGNLSYANNIKNASIGFACLSNFFSKYYQESYQGGKSALRLLNKIVCMFDDSILQYGRHVEKVKTFNDCYVFAGGLTKDADNKMKNIKRYLFLSLQFCFNMKTKLNEFNQDYIFGSEKFELKIGLSIGSVTAGIIGASKPTYDIWGDAVNVAGHLCSITKPGKIYVTKNFSKYLNLAFKFKSLGEFPIKGKGNMEIFDCESIIDKEFLSDKSESESGSSSDSGDSSSNS